MSSSGQPRESYAHLATAVLESASLEDDQRVKSMQRNRWIDYGRGTAVLERLRSTF
jgi:hypothetical protein